MQSMLIYIVHVMQCVYENTRGMSRARRVTTPPTSSHSPDMTWERNLAALVCSREQPDSAISWSRVLLQGLRGGGGEGGGRKGERKGEEGRGKRMESGVIRE